MGEELKPDTGIRHLWELRVGVSEMKFAGTRENIFLVHLLNPDNRNQNENKTEIGVCIHIRIYHILVFYYPQTSKYTG